MLLPRAFVAAVFGHPLQADEFPPTQFLKRQKRQMEGDVRVFDVKDGARRIEQITGVLHAGAHRLNVAFSLSLQLLVYFTHIVPSLAAIPRKPTAVWRELRSSLCVRG